MVNCLLLVYIIARVILYLCQQRLPVVCNYGVAEQHLVECKGSKAICAHIPQLEGTLVFVKENQSSD